MAARQGALTFAGVLKRSYQTYKAPGSESGKVSMGGGDGMSMVPRTFQSFSANCIMADFSGVSITKEKAFEMTSKTYEGIEGIKFIKQGKFVEVAFVSSDALMVAMGKDLQVGEIVIPVTRCFSPRQDVLPVAILGIPMYPKEDTYKEVMKVFNSYGKVLELKFHCFNQSAIRMDSCSVLLDKTLVGESCGDIPRRVEVFGKLCDLF